MTDIIERNERFEQLIETHYYNLGYLFTPIDRVLNNKLDTWAASGLWHKLCKIKEEIAIELAESELDRELEENDRGPDYVKTEG